MMHMPRQVEICEMGKEPRIVPGWELTGTDPDDEPVYEGVLAMHQHFVDCVRLDKDPMPGVRGEDGRAALEIVMAIYESAREGKAVKWA